LLRYSWLVLEQTFEGAAYVEVGGVYESERLHVVWIVATSRGSSSCCVTGL
jgi:hypothetical protein